MINLINQNPEVSNLKINKESFIKSLQLILDPQDLHVNDFESNKVESNSLSIKNRVVGVGYPRTHEQLKLIVKAASKHKVAIYPVSQGKNIGYGEMTPTGQNQFVIGLKHLNNIREFDAINGEVVVEPGVTQRQLAQFLAKNKAAFWADVTGASPEASIVGNTLEAGFGHTPIGDHRKHILQMEIMLVDGTIVKTAEMPAIGPDLAQLFVQSNFALVLSIRIPLFPIPEETVTFTIAFDTDKEFFAGVSVLSALRREGTISSLAHTGNATRTLMTSSRFPENYDPSHVLSEVDCHKILNQRSPIDFGVWSTVGGIYGFKADVKNKQKRIKKSLKGIAKVKFFSDKKMSLFDWLLNSHLALKIRSLDFIRGSFTSLKALHGILRGQPSDHPSENIFWRVDKTENLGLMWHAPVVPATKKDVSALLKKARIVYQTYGFEMPITLTLINAKSMTAVFNISYNKSDAEETQRAHAAYRDLSKATADLDYLPYRCGLATQAKAYYSPEQFECLKKIKMALDPQNILAPGRYGLGQRS